MGLGAEGDSALFHCAFPSGDYGGCHAVAEDVHAGAAHIDEGVNAEDHEDGGGGDVQAAGGGQQDDQDCAGNAGDALAGEQEGCEHDELLADSEVNSSDLSGEDGADGEVDAGAGHVEAVAGRDDEGDNPAGDAEGFHALHGEGECCLGGGGGEADGGGFGDGGKEAAEVDA